MAQQEILDDERLTVARRRAEKAEQEQQVLEHRPTSCRSRPAHVPSDFCARYVEEERGALGNGRCGEPAFALGAGTPL
jgi:hypothetical protein